MVPIISPFSLPVWPLQKIHGSWRVTLGYYQLKQVGASTAVLEM